MDWDTDNAEWRTLHGLDEGRGPYTIKAAQLGKVWTIKPAMVTILRSILDGADTPAKLINNRQGWEAKAVSILLQDLKGMQCIAVEDKGGNRKLKVIYMGEIVARLDLTEVSRRIRKEGDRDGVEP